MPGLHTIRPGMLTTVQDLGRYGHAALGVPPSGAADTLSLRVGNRLVGNPDHAPALEMTLVGGGFRFDAEAAAVLAGADCHAVITGPAGERPLPVWQAVRIAPGETIRAGTTRTGARTYLCIAGGIAGGMGGAPVLGSHSTHIAAAIGPAPLRAGDSLWLGTPSAPRTLPAPALELVRAAIDRKALRITPGPHRSVLNDADRLARQIFTVSERSNRMGLRLKGDPLATASSGRMITEGLPPGAVQLPESGEPIVLLADRPTTGGYPVVACIAAIDLPACGQLRPRDTIRFEPITIDSARQLLREFHAKLDKLLPPVS